MNNKSNLTKTGNQSKDFTVFDYMDTVAAGKLKVAYDALDSIMGGKKKIQTARTKNASSLQQRRTKKT